MAFREHNQRQVVVPHECKEHAGGLTRAPFRRRYGHQIVGPDRLAVFAAGSLDEQGELLTRLPDEQK